MNTTRNEINTLPILVPICQEVPETRIELQAAEYINHKELPIDQNYIYRGFISLDGSNDIDLNIKPFFTDLSDRQRDAWFTFQLEESKVTIYARLGHKNDKFYIHYYVESGQYIGTQPDLSITIPQIKITLTTADYTGTKPPKKIMGFGKKQVMLGFPALTLQVQPNQVEKGVLVLDLGYCGNTIRQVRVDSDEAPSVAITAPLMSDEIYEEVILDKFGNYKVTSKFIPKLEQQQPISFSAGYIDEHSSIGPKGSLIGERADEYLRNGDINLFESKKVFWSAKSKVNEAYSPYLKEISNGLARKVQLSGGKHRVMKKRQIEGEISLNLKANELVCSYPNTWHAAKRENLQKILADSFSVDSSRVSVELDEATAGAIGWYAGRFGHDMNPVRQLSLMAEGTLFANLGNIDIKEGLQRLAEMSEPLHYLVIDAGAGTTDIALIQIAYDVKDDKVVAKTLGKQGFEAGGLNITQKLCADWKHSLLIHLYTNKESTIDRETARQVLMTNVQDKDTKHISIEEKQRRYKLLVSLFECAELVKRMVSDSTVDHKKDLDHYTEEVWRAINQYNRSLVADSEEMINLDDVRKIINVNRKRVNQFCAEILGPSLYSAADLPIQYGVKRLSSILMIGRTLRLPNLTEAFILHLKERAEKEAQLTAEDWSQLVPPPHSIHSWNQDEQLSRTFKVKSDLHPNEDKRCVSNGLAMITASRKKAVDDFSFKPLDKHYRQGFVGAIKLDGPSWHHTMVHGVAPGQRPQEFVPNEEFYSLKMKSNNDTIPLFWNNLGVTHNEPICLKVAGQEYKLDEPIIKFGKIDLKIEDDHLRDRCYFNVKFTLIEDHRVKLHSVEHIMDDEELSDSHEYEEITQDTTLSYSEQVQMVKGTGFELTYRELEHDSDFRNTGIIDENDRHST